VIWLTWRQHRVALATGLAVLAVAALYVGVTASRIHSGYDALGLRDCPPPAGVSCTSQWNQFIPLYNSLSIGLVLIMVLPALVGAMWGAPLVAREIEQGTHRLAWTQSISRTRWLAVKVAVLLLATAAGLAVMTVLCRWWIEPFTATGTTAWLDTMVFDLVGVAPVAFGVAGVAIGVAAVTFTRRIIPAIAVTLVLFTGLRIVVDLYVRPHYMAPVTTSTPFETGPNVITEASVAGEPGWRLYDELMTADGRVLGTSGGAVDPRVMGEACAQVGAPIVGPPRANQPGSVVVQGPSRECVERLGLRLVTTYHPDDRYWRFQLTEAAIYLVLSAALLGASAWWIRHRLA
jgi:hypothetical protein